MAIPSFRDMNILTPTVIGDRVFTSSYGGGAMMFQVTRTDAGFAVKELWKNTTEAYMSSPVVVDGKIYLHLRNKRFSCIDPDSGESLWRTTPFGAYWSMVVNGSKLLAARREWRPEADQCEPYRIFASVRTTRQRCHHLGSSCRRR